MKNMVCTCLLNSVLLSGEGCDAARAWNLG